MICMNDQDDAIKSLPVPSYFSYDAPFSLVKAETLHPS